MMKREIVAILKIWMEQYWYDVRRECRIWDKSSGGEPRTVWKAIIDRCRAAEIVRKQPDKSDRNGCFTRYTISDNLKPRKIKVFACWKRLNYSPKRNFANS